MLDFCLKKVSSRSKYADISARRCYKIKGHEGKCAEFPYLAHLKKVAPKVAAKIQRDATMTTGASWSSKDAGPNRILRWVMLLSDEELQRYEINMKIFKPQVVAKIREKAASYKDCMEVSMKLTWLVYQMPKAPSPPGQIRAYLEAIFGVMQSHSTACEICKLPLSFQLFQEARRGRALIETCHFDPRRHNANNVGFAHRECNIAQGNKSLEEFYEWIEGILRRSGRLQI